MSEAEWQTRTTRIDNSMKSLLILACLLGAVSDPWAAETPHYRDLFPDTCVGRDALGRNMPSHSVVGPVKKDQRRIVGVFYITWHSDSNHKLKGPYAADVSRVLASDPKARLDAGIRSGPRVCIIGASRKWATS